MRRPPPGRAPVAAALLLVAQTGVAQDAAPPEPLRLRAAIAQALSSYGEVRASQADLLAAEERLALAKKAYLPELDVYAQWNRATRNNVYGLLLPGGNLPSISGPVIEDTTSEATYGSVAAALLRWDALDFGTRAAGVREAAALGRRADAGRRATKLQVSLGTVDAFLGVVGAESGVRAAEAAVRRMELFTEGVSALAENELRPGADLSLARAELARARTGLIHVERVRAEAKVSLGEWLGRSSDHIEVDGSDLVGDGPKPTAAGAGLAPPHPLVEAEMAARDAARARRDIASREYLPKIEVLGALYSRGTGASIDGSFEGGSAGLLPDTSNWAVGVAVRVPLLDLIARRTTKLSEYGEIAAEARYQQALQHASADLERARIRADAARRVAENTPVQLDAARTLAVQARARYDAGLADILSVAEAERLLSRAETEDALARLEVWRSRFAVGAAEGDLQPILAELE